jgi:hypothetical protein
MGDTTMTNTTNPSTKVPAAKLSYEPIKYNDLVEIFGTDDANCLKAAASISLANARFAWEKANKAAKSAKK